MISLICSRIKNVWLNARLLLQDVSNKLFNWPGKVDTVNVEKRQVNVSETFAFIYHFCRKRYYRSVVNDCVILEEKNVNSLENKNTNNPINNNSEFTNQNIKVTFNCQLIFRQGIEKFQYFPTGNQVFCTRIGSKSVSLLYLTKHM